MTNALADGLRLLERMIAPCDEGPSEHRWAKCKRCSAIAQLQDHDPLAEKLLRVVIDAVKAHP